VNVGGKRLKVVDYLKVLLVRRLFHAIANRVLTLLIREVN
jgi:hypothetical protein